MKIVDVLGSEILQWWPNWPCTASDLAQSCFDNGDTVTWDPLTHLRIGEHERVELVDDGGAVLAADCDIEVQSELWCEIEKRRRVGAHAKLKQRKCVKLRGR